MPAHHAKTRLLVVANARLSLSKATVHPVEGHSPSYGCALRLDQARFGALLGHARKTLRLCVLLLVPVAAWASHDADDPAPPPKWEGALGVVLRYAPEFAGASGQQVSAVPVFYLRYKRISISNGGGLISRRDHEDVVHGLGLDLVRHPRFRLNVGLRLDSGRRSRSSAALAGIDDVRRTVRARPSASWQFDDGWRASAGWSVDLLGRGGGQVLDASFGRERRLTPRTTWSAGAGLSWADGRHMRSYFGVTPAASAASGYPVYTPGSGLRSVSLGINLRTTIDRRWVTMAGASVGRLVGPAADSPLTASARQWSVSGGVAYNF